MTAPAATPVTPPVVDPKRQPVVEQGTEYVILRETALGTWIEDSLVTAKTPDAAIEAAIGKNDPGDNGWIAVATRYWSPQHYGVEVTRTLAKKTDKKPVTTLKLEEAK